MRAVALVLALLASGAGPTLAEQAAPADRTAQAYFEFLLARRLESQGDAAGALQALERALALDPDSAELHAELAGYHARQNDGAAAVKAAEKALEFDPDNAEAHRLLGLIYSAWSNGAGEAPAGLARSELTRRAVDHLSRIADTPAMATDLNMQLTFARLLMRQGDNARAVPVLENIVAQAPFASDPYVLLAEARLALGRTEAAAEALQAAAELNPRHYLALGELYERTRRWREAAAAYERSMEASGGRASRDLRLRYATVLLNVGDDASARRAREVLADLLVVSPQDQRGLFLLSSANLQLEDFEGAEAVAEKLLAIDPDSIPGLHAMSAALLGQHEYRRVVELLTPLVEKAEAGAGGRASEAGLLLAQLAHAHLELGERDRALQVLATAIERDPRNAPALNSLGYTLADRGERLSEAIGYIQRALEVEPDNPSYIDSLGWVLFKQGRYEDAEPHLRRAADALPQNSVVQDHYGDVLFQRGKYTEAIAAWERALAGDGEDIDREAILKKIRDARARQR